ncbi:MAG: hypothetical protein Q8R24_04575 [Legionellaceae bacterium]|nr:hypothetical protein [Legionellaceae bacterium]
MFFRTTEYPKAYEDNYQTYCFEKAQIDRLSQTCAQSSKYRNTLASIHPKYSISYPNPARRPLQSLTQDHQKKIKEEISLMRIINAIEVIHQKSFLLCNSSELSNNGKMKANCIYLYRNGDVIAYSLIAANGEEIRQQSTAIKPSNFIMTTLFTHKEDILKDAQDKRYILPLNTRTQAELTALDEHIKTLQKIHARLNSAYVGYAYTMTYGLMAASAIGSLVVVVMSLIGMAVGFSAFPWAPLLSLTFLLPAICCAYLAFKALDHGLNINNYEAPLKNQLGYYIQDNKVLLETYRETALTACRSSNSDSCAVLQT